MPRFIVNFLIAITKYAQQTNLILAIVLILVMLVGAFYSYSLGDQLRFLPDESDYVALADNLVQNHFYSLDNVQPTAYRAPGYPFFLAVFRFFGAGIVEFRLINIATLALCIFFLHRILIAASSTAEPPFPLAATIGALMVIGYPVLIFTAGTLYPQTLASLLLLMLVYCLARHPLQRADFILGGLISGWLILTAPAFAFVPFVLAVWLSAHRKIQPSRIILFIISAGLLVALWTFRNYTVFNTFIFVSTNSGENLLLGNSEHSQPDSGTMVDISEYSAAAAQMSEVERDQYFREQAISYIWSHPAEAAKLYILKVINYFNYRNQLVTQSESSWIRDLLMLLSYGFLLGVFILRLVLASSVLHHRSSASPIFALSPLELLFLALYISSALVTAVFFTRIRFRLPFDFLLIMLDATFLAAWIKSSGLYRNIIQPYISPESFLAHN